MFKLINANYDKNSDEVIIKLKPVRDANMMGKFIEKLNEIKNFRFFHILTSAKSDYTNDKLMDAAEAFTDELGED